MRILFADSGGLTFESRYAYGIYDTLNEDFICNVRQINPFQLSEHIISEFKPDLLLVVHGTFTPLHLVQYAKTNGAVTVLWLVEDPYEIDYHRGQMVETYDYVFTTEKQAVHEYKRSNVFYLPWCCSPRIHNRLLVPLPYHSDLCMVGVAFPDRVRIINAIAPVIKDLNVKLIGNWGEELVPELRKFIIPVICDFWEVQKYYCGAKINLNIHRNPVNPPSGNSKGILGTSLNDRTFALAGSGAFQLVDSSRPDVWECFNVGREIIVFNDTKDLTDKIIEYLQHPKIRESIANGGQQRAYLEHTFYHRLEEIFRKIDITTFIPNSKRSW
jgi:spore maturation protein CgeB